MSNLLQLHPDFRVNGQSFNSVYDLIVFVKKYLPNHYPFVKALFNDDIYIKVNTSGSTGTPKAILLKKEFIKNSAENTIDFFNLHPQISALLNLSSDYIAGKMMWVRAIIGGWYLHVISPENNQITKQLQKNTYDFGAMVPLQVYKNIDLLHKINTLIIGGAQISNELAEKINTIPTHIFATYGMTETITHIAVKPVSLSAKHNFCQNSSQKDVYRLLKGIEIHKNHRDCLVINAPDLSEDIVVTNDIIEIIDNKHFKWLGRFDNVINSGGIKLIPEQIEKKLSKFIKTHFFVAGLPDPKLGNKLVLFVEGKKTEINFSSFQSVLHKYEVPKKVVFISEFIKTQTGKINRKETILKAKNNPL